MLIGVLILLMNLVLLSSVVAESGMQPTFSTAFSLTGGLGNAPSEKGNQAQEFENPVLKKTKDDMENSTSQTKLRINKYFDETITPVSNSAGLGSSSQVTQTNNADGVMERLVNQPIGQMESSGKINPAGYQNAIQPTLFPGISLTEEQKNWSIANKIPFGQGGHIHGSGNPIFSRSMNDIGNSINQENLGLREKIEKPSYDKLLAGSNSQFGEIINLLSTGATKKMEKSMNKLTVGSAKPQKTAHIETGHIKPTSGVTVVPGKTSIVNGSFNDTPWNHLRLPSNVVPVLYTIILKPNLTEGYFTGLCNIVIQIKQPTSYIILHSKGLNYSQILVVAGSEPMTAEKRNLLTHYFFKPEFEYLVLTVDGGLKVGEAYRVQLEFSGITQDDKLLGLYRSKYTTRDGQLKFLALTKFEPTDARRAFPCFDEPEFKAKFQMNVIHDPQYKALGNMPAIRSNMLNGSLMLTEFNQSMIMSTYLVAIVVSDFQFTSGKTQEGTEVRVYARPEQVQSASFAVNVAVKTLEFFADYYGVPYPLPKSDLVAIPDFKSGAMENWGLITFRETSLLYDPQESSIVDKEKAMKTIIHELGHMWFGNLVTMRWWDDLWLNEGFARFTEQLAGDNVEPNWHLHEKFVPRVIEHVMLEEEGALSHPIVLPVYKPHDINSMFDSITYEKGASVIYMLEAVLGTKQFKKGLKNYLNTFALNNTVTLDLWQKLSEVSKPKLNVSRFMDTWTKQEGFPIVNIERYAQSPNQLLASQQRYFSMPNDSLTANYSGSPFNFLWQLPLTYINPNTGSMDIQWLNQSEQTLFQVPISNQPIKFNVNNTGYYMVNYEEDVWLTFARKLNTNHNAFTTTDRANLLDDAFSLSKGGYMYYRVAFEMVKYLPKEEDYVPFAAAVPHFTFLADSLESTKTYPLIQNFIYILLTSIYQKYGFRQQINYQKICTQTQILTLMCKLNYPPCITEAVNLFKKWKAGRLDISPDLKVIVYKYGLQSSFNVEDWEYLWKGYMSNNISAQEKDKYLTALAATRKPSLIHRLIKYVKDPKKIRSQDFFTALGRLAENPIAVEMVWNFIRSDWKSIVDRFSLNSNNLGKLFKILARSFNTPHRIKQMEEFIEKYPNIGAGQLQRKQALEIVKRNIEWLGRCSGLIHEALMRLLGQTTS